MATVLRADSVDDQQRADLDLHAGPRRHGRYQQRPPGSLDILGIGTATLTGFDPTRGSFAFSTQNGVTATVTFSATVAVPEPASLALFGAGLLGMGLVRRGRRTGALLPNRTRSPFHRVRPTSR